MALENGFSNSLTNSLRFSAGPPSNGQTAKNFVGQVSTGGNGANVTLETVTAGKTFYITDVVLSTDSSTAYDVQIKAGSTAIFETFISTTAPCNAPGIETQPFATSGVVVTLVTTAVSGKNLDYVINGYEQ